MKRQKISIVVPIYNEQSILPELTHRIDKVISSMTQYDWEVLYVDDGSSDGSAMVLDGLAQQHAWLKVLFLSRNFGHQTAITAGVDQAGGDAIILMDGDLQDPPEVLPELIAQWEKGFDVVTARRKKREGESAFKLVTAFLFYRMLRWMSNTNIPVDTGDFRLLGRNVAEALRRMPERSRFFRGMVSWAGFRQTEIQYERDRRFSGSTKYTFAKMFRLATNGILSFSKVPLQLIIGLGILFSIISFLGILVVFYETIVLHSTVRGWSSLICAVLFMGSVQLICIGMIGSYVGRIFDEVRARPLYFIRNVVGQRSDRLVNTVWMHQDVAPATQWR